MYFYLFFSLILTRNGETTVNNSFLVFSLISRLPIKRENTKPPYFKYLPVSRFLTHFSFSSLINATTELLVYHLKRCRDHYECKRQDCCYSAQKDDCNGLFICRSLRPRIIVVIGGVRHGIKHSIRAAEEETQDDEEEDEVHWVVLCALSNWRET